MIEERPGICAKTKKSRKEGVGRKNWLPGGRDRKVEKKGKERDSTLQEEEKARRDTILLRRHCCQEKKNSEYHPRGGGTDRVQTLLRRGKKK